LLFAANYVPQTLEQMQEFSESITAVVNKTASTEEEQRAQDDGTGDDNV
jgi:lipopolysaccharide biosynthesis protein